MIGWIAKEFCGRGGVRKVHDALDVEAAVVRYEVHAQSAFFGSLDEDVYVCWEGLLVVEVLLGRK